MLQKSERDKHKKGEKETLGKVIQSNLLSLLKIFLVCFVLVYFTINYLFRPIPISGPSMYPTLRDHEFALTNAFAAQFLSVERGDIVIAYEGGITHKLWIKRVIALPGETVSCRDDVVYINGKPYSEPYLENDFSATIRATAGEMFTDDFDEVKLGEDEYWLMGDNRKNSFDSRRQEIGPFKRSDIKGKGVLVLFPFNKIRIPE